MATIKISELPAILGANTAATDVLPIVDTSLSTTNKITREEFFKNVPALEVAGDVTIADKIIHAGDTNTSIRFPAADTVTVETSGAERVRVDSSGDVGIGTSSPTQKLDVRGYAVFRTSDATTANNAGVLINTASSATAGSRQAMVLLDPNGADGGGTDYSLLRMYGSGEFELNNQLASGVITLKTAATERMRIDSSGNVGIGTTSPTSIGANITTLNVAGSAGGGIRLQRTASTATDSYIAALSGELRLASIGSIPMTFLTNNTERLRIDSSGNVGIGTSSPDTRLTISSSGANGLNLAADQGNSLLSARLMLSNGTSGQSALLMNNNGGLAFQTGATPNSSSGTERMRIDSSGNIGIGTSSPSYTLDVGLTSRSTDAIRVLGGNTASADTRLILASIGNGGSGRGVAISLQPGGSGNAVEAVKLLGLQESTSATANNASFAVQVANSSGTLTERMRIDPSGNVGIGTTSPNYRLTLGGGTNNSFQILSSTTGSGATNGLRLWNTGSSTAVYNYDNTPLLFGTNNAERMRIDSSGNVGIGTSSPSTRLHVSGDTTLGGAVVETVFALSGTTPAINPSNGTIQTWTLSGNSTPTDSLTAGESVTLMIDDGTAYTITWPSVTWVNNGKVAPTLATTGYTVVALWKVSTTLYGALVGDGT